VSAAGDKLCSVVKDETAVFERCEVLLNGSIVCDVERRDDRGGAANAGAGRSPGGSCNGTCFGFWLGFVWGTWC